MQRNDLTNWIIHFVHRRNPENDPMEFSNNHLYIEHETFPDSFTYEGTPIFKTEKYIEDDYGLTPDADAIYVLKKILYDGIIRTGWSFRKGKPSIYGPKSAACFTEMPLYALIQYSQNRSNEYSIQPYGIAFLKEELFMAGARPVIYGLSGKHKETKQGDKNYGIGLRTLSDDCGIGLREMYRYIYTNISSSKRIDWTHEREWRWADLDEKFSWFAGLPFFAKNDEFSFSRIIIFVKTTAEVDDILEHLQNLYHSKTTNFDTEYDLNIIENAHVLSVEDLAMFNKDISSINLDDLPLSSILKFEKIVVSLDFREKVKKVISAATKIYLEQAELDLKEFGDVGPCGWLNIVTYVSNSKVTQALVDLESASSFGKGPYQIYLDGGLPVQSLRVDQKGKELAAEFLTKELNQKFYTQIHWD